MGDPTTAAPDHIAGAGKLVERAGDAILENIRGRRLLKWLFAKNADTNPVPIGYIDGPIDLETQQECVQTWARLALALRPQPTLDREAIARAITAADEAFCYSFNLTRLIDGEATHTLTMPGYDPVDFDERDDGYRLIAARRDRMRADAIIALIGAGREEG